MVPEWIAVDWGQTLQRAWAMRGSDVLDRVEQQGVEKTDRDALIDLVFPWLGQGTVPVVTCGALGPLGPAVPCRPFSDGTWAVSLGDDRVNLHMVPGIRQSTPPDMMTGDETRVAGFLALNKDWDGVVCLTGQQSRWVHVSAGEVVSFQTFLTGSMLSVLKHVPATTLALMTEGFDRPAFIAALEDAIAKPERILARLYGVHADGVMNGLEPEAARARIFGALIGAELAAARPFWLGQQLAVIGDDPLASLYVEALTAQGAPAALADEARMTLQGLIEAWRLLVV